MSKSAIDVSTQTLAEYTSDSTQNKASTEEILMLWYAIGKFVGNQLVGGKGIKMSSFGIFTLSQTSSPIFILAADFSSQYKVKQVSLTSAENIPTTLLNFAYIAKSCDMDRDRAEKIYSKLISCLGRLVCDGRTIVLSIHKVSEIRINKGQLVCDFIPDFLSYFNDNFSNRSGRGSSKLSASTSRPRSATPTYNRKNSSASLTSSNIESVSRRYSKVLQGGGPDPREVAARAVNNSNVNSEAIIQRIRDKIIERGGNSGMRTLTRLLMIMDDNGDKKISKDELKYGLRDYGIDLNPAELEGVFTYFDRDRNGFIDITEFLVGLRGEMNNRRKSMIRLAFDILDSDRSGVVTIDEIQSKYDFTQDPDVKEGRKTIQQACRDFMAVWERGERDGLITYDEFEEYYKDISASIDEDDYFELMIRNAWRIAGGTGMAANTANRRVLVTKADGSQYVETINNELGLKAKDTEGMRARLRQQGVEAVNLETHGYQDNMNKARRSNVFESSSNTTNRGQQMQRSTVMEAWGEKSSSNRNARSSSAGPNRAKAVPSQASADPLNALRQILYNPPASLEQICNKLQVSLASSSPRMAMGAFKSRISTLDPSLDRNAINDIYKAIDTSNAGHIEVSTLHNMLTTRYGKDKTTSKNSSNVIERAKAKIFERCGDQVGIKGLARVLAIMDDDGDKKLTRDELKYGLQDYGIELNIRELEDLFSYFDRDRNGVVDINEFLVGMRGDLNDRRRHFVQLAFNILDRDNSGMITIDEIAAAYDVSKNPEVIAGRKTKDQAYRDFMAQWDKGDRDGIVTYEEFEDYYKEVSASIDGDDYFELMIRNAWRIPGGTGMAANTANRRVLVTKADGSQYVETINNELGLNSKDVDGMRNRLKQQGVEASNIDTFGYQDNTSKPGRPRSASFGGGNTRSAAPQRTAYDRNMAAMKVAAVYRGKLARNKFELEKRKVVAKQKQQEEDAMDASRPRPRQILRPKGKSYIGF